MLARGPPVTHAAFAVSFGLIALLTARPARSQDTLPPWEGGITRSLGQPRRLHLQVGAMVGGDWRGGHLSPNGALSAAATHGIGSPVVGLAATSLEAFAGFRGDQADAGLRALLTSPTLRLTAGVEFGLRDGRTFPLIGYTMPVRRGGIFGGGSLLRVEWLPGAGKAFRVATTVPVKEPLAGRTRPRPEHVRLPSPEPPQPVSLTPSPALADALAILEVAARRIAELVVPYLDAPGGNPFVALAPVIAQIQRAPNLPGYRPDSTAGVDQVVRIYHRQLERAFAVAATGRELAADQSVPEGEVLARQARAALREHVLYPFNRLLGQKKRPASPRALLSYARGHWARELVARTSLTPEREAAVLYVFERLLDVVEDIRATQLRAWGDTRLQWLPLQLGLLPEEHDTQAELDAILAAAIGQPFADGNEVWYVINGQFQLEVTNSILAARDYHVLWIHDFRGRNAKGEPDALSLRYVADAYLGALAAAVTEYDQRRVMPSYFIFLDEHYYQANRGRLWLDFLERPLGPLPKLPKGFEAYDSTLRRAQARLATAIETSRLLQAERRQYGNRWLENLTKVHVNITHPADMSFWGRDIVPILGLPDNLMRDHRKIAFYDVSEADPYRGLAIYTGMGVGEHYAGAAWEDRAIMARGPVLISLKDQARRLLESHGMTPEQIPYALRPRPKAPDYQERIQRFVAEARSGQSHDQRAMELHNLTGYQEKPINVAKAVLYTLMPPGSVIKAPDSLWGSSLYAALLAGSALRGVRVLVVAPSLASAPAPAWPSMGVAHELLSRLIVLQQQLGAEIERAGGLLKTGLYSPGIGVEDVARRFSTAYQNARRTAFLRRLYPVHQGIDTLLMQLRRHVEAATPEPRRALVSPRLHLKANWFSSREAWDSLISRPELGDVLAAYLAQIAGPAAESLGAREVAAALTDASQRLIEALERERPAAERARAVYYLMVGSANQDYRSMFMDGEASVLISGWSTVVGLIDFALITSLSIWVDDLALLDALLPSLSPFRKSVARLVRPAL